MQIRTVLKAFQDRWRPGSESVDAVDWEPIPDRAAVPRDGTVQLHALRPEDEVRFVSLTFAVDGPSQWRCTALTVQGEDLTTRQLAGLRLADLTTGCVMHVAKEYDPETGSVDLSRRPDRAGLFASGARRRRSRTPVTTERLTELAQLYRAAVAAGSRRPAADVAAQVNLSPATVRQYIVRARQDKLLAATTRGKAQS